VLSALTAGRLREALAPAAAPPNPGDPEYLSGRSGTLSRRDRTVGAARDLLAAGAAIRSIPALRLAARRAPRRRVRAVIVARPEHARTTARLRRELARSRHEVHVVEVPPAAGAGKWANINAALGRTTSEATNAAARGGATNVHAALDRTSSAATNVGAARDGTPPEDADWLLLVDDDVVLPRGFLDRFLVCAERYGFRLAQPAHAFASHAAWTITRRRPGLVARRTNFVEIGPVTAIHRDAFAELLPFPDLQMGWGLDNHWSALAAEHGWPIGIVDATPVRHLRPVAGDYPREAAIAEAEAFLDGRAYVTRSEAETPVAEYR
jgi:hypothetical protein